MLKKWNVTIPKLSGDKPRRAYIWLPDDYEKNSEKRYPVMYMFDGHNVFLDIGGLYHKIKYHFSLYFPVIYKI